MPFKTKEQKREYARLWVARRRADFFADKQCVRCGSTETLELDHINPATKVAHTIWSWSQSRREAEIAKCQILCHGCHVTKTRENGEAARGEQAGQTKLSEPDVRLIRKRYAAGERQVDLAREFRVDRKNVFWIVNRITWTHI